PRPRRQPTSFGIFPHRPRRHQAAGDSMNEQLPVLSLRERDRRWQRVRDLMRAHELECLIVGGYRGRERYECYITDDYVEGAVIFPLEGEPTALTWTGLRI